MQQPVAFQERVVLGVIESHLHEEEAALMPTGWTPNGLTSPHNQHGVRIISLPYPISVTDTKQHHQKTQSLATIPGTGAAPIGKPPRSILALFAGSLDRGRHSNTGRQGQGNRLRVVVVKAMQRQGAICTADACGICAKGEEKTCEALILHQAEDRHWELAANSIFCVEPPGDTLTRSHFFVGVVSGCIPVVFDGGDGSALYSEDRPTLWPWRVSAAERERPTPFGALLQRVGVDYSDFTVIVNASEVLGLGPISVSGRAHPGGSLDSGSTLGHASFLGRLISMSSESPSELQRLQLGVDANAPAMIYSPSRSVAFPRRNDAFARFFAIVTAPSVMRRKHHHGSDSVHGRDRLREGP